LPAATAQLAYSLSDRSLLRRFRSGDQDAATRIYLRYAQRLWALANAHRGRDLAPRLDADDIVQSVFRSFFKAARTGLYDVPAGDELWKLLLVLALNKIRAKGAFHRAAKRDVRLTTGADAIDSLAGCKKSDEQAYAILRLAVEETLSHLPDVSRDIVVLRMEGCEVAEIAAKTGRSKRTIERNLQAFRKKLAQLLDAE
jgi:RNA polymerase sigma-70 factor, ECF subfamily